MDSNPDTILEERALSKTSKHYKRLHQSFRPDRNKLEAMLRSEEASIRPDTSCVKKLLQSKTAKTKLTDIIKIAQANRAVGPYRYNFFTRYILAVMVTQMLREQER